MQISYDKDRVVYAGFFPRLAAFLLDSVLVSAALSIFKFIVWIIKLSVGDIIIFKPILSIPAHKRHQRDPRGKKDNAGHTGNSCQNPVPTDF